MSHAITDVLVSWHARRELRSRRLREHPARHTAEIVPPLSRGEHALARSGEPTHAVLGTDRAMYVSDGHGAWRRTRWADVASIGWSRVHQCIEIRTWAAGTDNSALRVKADARFAAFANERVAATRLLSTRAELLPGLFGLVVAVRGDANGPVRWQIVVDPHENADGVALRDACARLIAELRGIAGC
jgi:hypothetical protein